MLMPGRIGTAFASDHFIPRWVAWNSLTLLT